MVLYTISNTSEWETIASGGLSNGDMVVLENDITFNALPTLMTMSNGSSFNGGSFTITMNFATIQGIFIMNGGSVEYLTISGNANSLDANEGLFCNYATGGSGQWGDFTKCVATDVTIGASGGGVCGYQFGHATNNSAFTRCPVNATLGQNAGGVVGAAAQNITVEKSCFEGTFSGTTAGGIVGANAGSGVSVSKSFCNAAVSTSGSGGIIASHADGETVSISECICFGAITGAGAGGFIGTSADSGTVNIDDCYTAGQINNSSAGGFVGTVPGTSTGGLTVTIDDCYQAGTVTSGGSVVGSYDGSGVVNAVNTVTNGSTLEGTGTGTVASSGPASSSDLGTIDDNTVPMQWSRNKWRATMGVGEYPRLSTFTNLVIWGTGYDSYNVAPAFKSLNPINARRTTPGTRIRMKGMNSQLGMVDRVGPLGVQQGLVIMWDSGPEFTSSTLRAYFGKSFENNIEEL